MIEIQHNIIGGQSKGCWLCVQIRYTRFMFIRFWNSKNNKQGKHIYFFAPVHDPDTGYHCTRIGIR